MIDIELLHQLGWSNELIQASQLVAGELRKANELLPEVAVKQRTVSVACSEIYSDAVVSTSARDITS